MQLFDALGYAHAECGKIAAIRNGKKEISYPLLADMIKPPQFTDEEWLTVGWEIGWWCPSCDSTGKMLVYLFNGVTKEIDCPDCEAGIKWEGEY